MKPILEYLINKHTKYTKHEYPKLKAWDEYKWGKEYIKSEDLLKFIVKALKISDVKPKDILDEFGYYKDPGELWDAYDRGETTSYCEFEKTLNGLLYNDTKYSGKEGDILDYLFDVCYGVMEEVEKYLENQ